MSTSNVVNVKKIYLNIMGFKDFNEWKLNPNNVYIGRKNCHVDGTEKSKWANPFSVKKYGRDQCLILYENYIRNTSDLWDSLYELDKKNLGCWCHEPLIYVPCHGNILIKLINERYYSNDLKC